jgi:phage-related protein
VRFFAQESGTEPVHDWLLSLSREDQKTIGDDIRIVEFGWPVGMPTCRSLGRGLHEVRTNLKDRIARVMFTIVDDKMVLLHGFIKKSRTTPTSDLELARTRLQIVRRS